MRHYPRFLTPLLLGMASPPHGELKAAEADFRFRRIGPIVDADPAVREEREVLAPTGFQTARTAEVMAVCERAGPLKSIKLKVGHKMVLGFYHSRF